MQIKKLALVLAVVLALGASGLVAFAAFSAAPAPADILTRAVTNLQNAQDGHAILQIQGTSPDQSGSATVEVWAKKVAAGSDNYKYRVQVNNSTLTKYQGAVAVSDGTTFWAYLPISNTVYTGPVSQMDQSQHTPQELIQQLLDYTTPSLVSSAPVNGHSTYQLKLVPTDKAPAAAAGATGQVWIDQSSYLPWQANVNAGSTGQGQITAQVLELNIGVSDDRFQFQIPAGAKVVQLKDLQPQHLTVNEAQTAAGFTLLNPSALPSGATLVDVLKAGNAIVYKYESPNGSFALEQRADAKGNLPATGGESVQVRGTTGTIYTSKDGSHLLLTWVENGHRYSVSGSISRADALKLAESLK